ncbi:MAG: DUF3267 domain-containing protein [Lachnospiraceae bacterium]|nr:DUF3267 domain-containing protein [Lachnospiraceae bacterium]
MSEEKEQEQQEQQTETRKLTKAEQRRLELFQKLSEELAGKGYVKKNLTTTAILANTLGFMYGGVLGILFAIPYFVFGCNKTDDTNAPLWGMLTMVLFIVLIVVHELIHGITWALGMKGGFKNIEFGFIVQYLTPYCTCKVPMRKLRYILGSMMPCITLGFLPCIVSYFTGNGYLLVIGVLMIMAAGGDLLVTQMILTHKYEGKDQLFVDHPTEIGLALFEK